MNYTPKFDEQYKSAGPYRVHVEWPDGGVFKETHDRLSAAVYFTFHPTVSGHQSATFSEFDSPHHRRITDARGEYVMYCIDNFLTSDGQLWLMTGEVACSLVDDLSVSSAMVRTLEIVSVGLNLCTPCLR